MRTNRSWEGALVGTLFGAFVVLAMAFEARADEKHEGQRQKARQVHSTGKEDGKAPSAEDEAAERKLEAMTNRSGDGLTQVQRANGTVAVNLEERFMHVMRAVPDAKGGMKVECSHTADHKAQAAQPAPVVSKPSPVLEEK